MMKKLSPSALYRIVLVAIAIGMALPPQIGLTELTLGRKSFSTLPAPALMNPMRLSAGSGSFRFRARVGGVAFGSSAENDQGLNVVAMEYRRDAVDGERLIVTLADENGKTSEAVAPVYDWQFVPVCRFAASDQDACFTLFGDLDDVGRAQKELDEGNRILNYHPAFKDTLMGLRLFQADILIFDPDSIYLPELDGEYLLGNGEKSPDVSRNEESYDSFQTRLEAIQNEHDKTHRSYVICDEGRRVTFAEREGLLVLTGRPFWSCWRYKVDEAELDALIESADNEAIDRLIKEVEQDEKTLSEYELGLKWTEAKVVERKEELFDEIISPRILDTMPDYSNQVSESVEKAGFINPAVYEALVTTMRYSALFRHFKSNNPDEFQRFLDSIEDVRPSPEVETPTVMHNCP